MPKNKSSLVWQYFDKPDEDTNIAKCKLCDKDLKTSGNTTNLLSHMKQKHSDIRHPQVEPKQESNTDSEPTPKKPKIIDNSPKFREEWLLDPICKDWIEEIPEFPSKAHCKYCDVTIRAKYADVKQHIRSRKHNKKCLRYATCNQSDSINNADISLNDICVYNDRRDQNYSYEERISNHNFERVSEQESRLMIRKPAPEWNATAVIDGEFKQLKLSDFRGQYLVFFFYRLDFTPVCPTEILAFNDRIGEFHDLNTEVVGCSVDSHFTHLAWTNTLSINEGMGKLKIPLLSDVTHRIAKSYGVYIEDQGVALRALFIIDPKGILRQITMNDHVIVRSVDETLRLIQVLQFSDKHGEVCHAGWRPDEEIIELQIIPNTEECRINIDENQKYDENLIVEEQKLIVEEQKFKEEKFAVSSNERSVKKIFQIRK